MPYWNPYVSFNSRVRSEGLNYHVRNRAGVRKYGSGYIENSVQEAIGSLRNSRTEKEKAVLDLNHDRKSKQKEHSIGFPVGNTYGCIELPDWTILKLIGNIVLADSTNKNIIANKDGATGNKHCSIIGESSICTIDGNKNQQTSGSGIYFIVNPADYGLVNLHIENLTLWNFDNDGVHLEGIAGESKVCLVKTVKVDTCGGNAWYLKYIVDSKFIACYSGGYVGIKLVNSNCNDFVAGYWGAGGGSINSVVLESSNKNHFNGGTIDAAVQNLVKIAVGVCWQNRFTGLKLSNANYGGVDEAYSGILLSGADIKHNIFGDLVFYKSGGQNNFRYCIEEASSTDYNIYHGLNMQNYGGAFGGLKKIGANSKADADTIIGTIV